MATVDIMSYYGGKPEPSGEPDYICFTANKAGATLRMMGGYSEDYTGPDFALEYSTDGENWQPWTFTKGDPEDGTIPCASDTLTFNSVGDKVYFRGNNTEGTSYFDVVNEIDYYLFMFVGAVGTSTLDNEFAVTGDLQTIVKDDGTDKEHGCFGAFETGLFNSYPDVEIPTGYMLITSAPDLTATTLVPFKYSCLFMNQTLLTQPANMPLFSLSDLPLIDFGEEVDPGYAFYYMYYGCSSLTSPCDFSGIVVTTEEDAPIDEIDLYRTSNVVGIYYGTTFDITSDDGLSGLVGMSNINFPIYYPFEDNGQAYMAELTSFYFACSLGNINGFDCAVVYIEQTSGGYAQTKDSEGVVLIDNVSTAYWIPNNGEAHAGCSAYPSSGYHFVKWQSSTDGETWDDIPGATSKAYTATITQPGDYYYKAIFEQD